MTTLPTTPAKDASMVALDVLVALKSTVVVDVGTPLLQLPALDQLPEPDQISEKTNSVG